MSAIDTKFPFKVELHVHMDVAVRYQTILDLGKLKGIFPATETIQSLKKQIVLDIGSSVDKIFGLYKTYIPVFAGDRDAVYRMAYEFCEDRAKQGVKYSEARFFPHALANNSEKPLLAAESGSFSPRDVISTVLDAFEQGQKDFNIQVKGIVGFLRDHPEWILDIGQLHSGFKDKIVALDIVSSSTDIDPSIDVHKLLFLEAERLGIHRTAHAFNPKMINDALEGFHAERISQCYGILEDKILYDYVLQNRIHMETCPMSSLKMFGKKYTKKANPILSFAKDRANFSINSDDPTVLDNSLSDDYALTRKFGLTDDQITQSIFNAARSCFAPEAEKKNLISELVKVYGDKWLSKR